MYGFLKRFIHHHNQLDWQIYNWIIEEDVKRCDRYRIFFHNKKRKLEIVWYKQSKENEKDVPLYNISVGLVCKKNCDTNINN